jgi:tetratricopeptide (TPR) repeat protein
MTLGPEAVDVAAIEHEAEAPSAPLAPAATRRGVRALSAYAVPLLLALATFAVFAPALWNQFVEWDDQMILTQNENYRGLGPTQLKYFFTTFLMGHYVPLTWLTFGLDYVLWGMNPMGYHLTSLIIYAANAVVLYFVALRLLGKAAALADVPLRVGAVAATLFFTLHPLRAESVAWATERRDVLSGLFFLLTILAYLKMCDATGGRRRRLLVGSAASFVLALVSKGSVMVLPAVLLVLDAYPLRRLSRRVLVEKIPFVALGLAGAAVTYYAQNANAFLTTLERYPLSARIGMTFYGLWFYLWKTLVPMGLGPLYELPVRVNPLDWRFLGPTLVVTALILALLALRRRWPAGLAVFAYYAIALGPVIGIVHSGHQLTHDRYSYLPGLGLAMMFGGLAGVAARGAAAGAFRPVIAKALAAVGVLWIAGLGTLALHQVQIWRDTDTLWRFALDSQPDCVVCHNNFGAYLANTGLFGLALGHFERALAIRPDQVSQHYQVGLIHAISGDPQKAVDSFRIYLRQKPNDPDALSNLAVALVHVHKPEEALDAAQTAVRVNPKHAAANSTLGHVLLALGRREEALRQFRRAIELKSDTPQAWHGLIRAFLETGQPDAARTAHGILGMVSPLWAKQIAPLLLTTW